MTEMFQQDLDRDGVIVRMCMAGAQVQAGIKFDMKPDVLLQHGRWLAAQPEAYITQVVQRVEEIMDKETVACLKKTA